MISLLHSGLRASRACKTSCAVRMMSCIPQALQNVLAPNQWTVKCNMRSLAVLLPFAVRGVSNHEVRGIAWGSSFSGLLITDTRAVVRYGASRMKWLPTGSSRLQCIGRGFSSLASTAKRLAVSSLRLTSRRDRRPASCQIEVYVINGCASFLVIELYVIRFVWFAQLRSLNYNKQG